MSYLTKDDHGLVRFSVRAKNDYSSTSVARKDAVLMDMLGEMGFNCGKTRWDSPILFTHMDSRKIVIAINCPTGSQGWEGCPHTTPSHGKKFAFVHEQAYEIRIMDQIRGFKTIVYEEEFPSNMLGAMHWFQLPSNIRRVWASHFS